MTSFERAVKRDFKPLLAFLGVWAGAFAPIGIATTPATAQVVLPQNGLIATLAGNGTVGYSGDSGLATAATLNSPLGIALDGAGNIYIVDTGNNVIRKETAATGIITTVAGNGTGGYSGDGNLAINAELNGPGGIAVDPAGNIYIADQGNCVIRMVTASTGVITTIVGSATNSGPGYSGDGGLATQATLAYPFGVSLDAAGNIYIVDQNNSVVRKVTVASGIITTVAGNGTPGYSGDGGLATSAELNYPSDVRVDSNGNIFIADTINQVVREVAASTGIITTIAGNGILFYSGDGGPATSASLGYPLFLALDSAGDIFIADTNNNAVRKVTAATGIISTVVGNDNGYGAAGYSGDGGLATAALINFPAGLAIAPIGNSYSTGILYLADSNNNVIRVAGGYRTNAPTFSPVPATYSSPQSVIIGDSVSGATIYYTTDGTVPTTSSSIYSGPVSVNSSETLNAIAVSSSGQLTAVATAPYTITQVVPTVNFASGFSSTNLNLNYGASIVSGALQLSDDGNYEFRTAWFTTPVSSHAFTSDFTYQATSAVADGITFTLQNDPDGIDALGDDGEGLGYGNIQSSVAIKLDLYNNLGEGTDSTGYYIDGAPPILPALDMTASGVVLRSGDLMQVHATYDGSTLTWTISDTVSHATFTDSVNIDIPTIVGGDTAFAGITGSTGTFASTQVVPTWTLISGPATTFAATPVFSPVAATYSSARSVTITDAIAGATIYYTTDGTTPTTSSNVYMGPITVSATETLNAIAVASGYYSSPDASAAYTIASGVTLSVAPASVTLYGGQSQQFSATVSGNADTAVSWSVSPAGVGTVNAYGLYSAPATISAQQSVTITATSQADSTKSATASLTLVPPACVSNGYSYERSIVIDHTKVPNTDLTNFPLLFNTSDPTLATTANGGHVANSAGFDIIFSTDPAGLTRLDHELEEYNPVTGQVIAWVRMPTLSHTTDTVLYIFYGNSSITASLQNPSGVWDSDFQAIYHLDSVGAGIATDSSGKGNNGTLSSVTAAFGEVDGGISFNGSSSYIQIPAVNFGTYPITGDSSTTQYYATFETWFKTSSTGVILGQTGGSTGPGNIPTGWGPALYVDTSGYVRSSLFWHGETVPAQIVSPTPYNDNDWHFAVDTYSNGTETLYLDGSEVGSQSPVPEVPNGSPYEYFLGTGYASGWPSSNNSWFYFTGALDEARISSVARSAEWIASEFNNQSSPATFYMFGSESSLTVSPAEVSLAASQSQQFAATSLGSCTASVAWSLPSGAPGSLTPGGQYTAPPSVTTAQSFTVTATSLVDDTKVGTANVNLLPPLPTLTLAATAQSPYTLGSSQGFIATVTNANGVTNSGIVVTFVVLGVNGNTATTTSDASGLAIYSYVGVHSGNDTVQAHITVNGQQVSSNTVAVMWAATPPVTAEGGVILSGGPNLGMTGLCGAFTDDSGTIVQVLAVGAMPISFVVPAGATQLQLGVVDNRYADNTGSGFVVEVNGVMVNVLPTSMPWLWASGGLNSTYQYSLLDGTSPVIAASNLTSGETINIAYQSGTVSAGVGWPLVNANGEQSYFPGVGTNLAGVYFPTLYLTSASYPIGQSITFTAMVANSAGTPLVNIPVTLSITGANARQFQVTTDSTGTARVTYVGIIAGTDTVVAQAYPSGEATLVSNLAAVTWVTYSTPPLSGTLNMTPTSVSAQPQGGVETFTVLAKDASGTPVANVTLNLSISGVDNFQLSAVTNSSGQAFIPYTDVNSGTSYAVAIGVIDGGTVFSNSVTIPWTLPPSTTTTSNGSDGVITIDISAQSVVTMPTSLQLNGSVTDSNVPTGASIAIAWTKLSGPGTVTFSNSAQPVTTASFSQFGDYVLELSANDTVNSGSVQIPITVNPAPNTTQGWIGAPLNDTAVSGIVPITVAPGESLQSGTLTYYPAVGNPSTAVVLNANTTGSGQIGTLDTTQLANGSYWIQLQATDTSGNSSYNLVFVTVTGNYKPGRVTATVTDLVVPATGLAINIQRSYDSLNAASIGDFGFGWNLGTTVNLTVDTQGNVTFTLGGQRRTFYFEPQQNTFLGLFAAAYTAEPGFSGTLTDSASGCSDFFDFVYQDGSAWFCYGGGQFSPPGYIYTDPSGTQYTISASGSLQSVIDRAGNALSITPNGITSSTGLSVPFIRDSQGRITQITDTLGNQYLYTYDTNGNLATVTYPNTTQPSTYTYAANHYYTGGTDFRSNPLPVTSYYGTADTDPNGLPLNGRLESVTDSLSETTSYAYNLLTNTTTVTYPQDARGNVGTATMVYDSYGMLLTSTDPLGHTTTNVYDANHNLISVTDPLGHTTTNTYDSLGNKTSTTYPATATSTNTTSYTTYNQYSEPISTTDELGNTRTFNYDANYNPQSVTDTVGTLASFLFNPNTTLAAGAIGFDITAQPAQASQFTYDANGNLASRTDALGRTTSYTYNPLGQKLTMTEPPQTAGTSLAAATTIYSYDALGNLTQTAAPLSRTTSSTYDANNNKISDTDPRGNVTTYQYDSLNRLTTTTYPTSPATTMTMTYDFRNNVINKTDQAGHVTHNTYDLAGRLISTTQAYGTSDAATTSYEYDNAGRKTTESDPLGHVTTWTYDAAGNLTATSGVKGTFSYSYDNARNQISRTDANSHTTQSQYDSRKRLTKVIYPDSTSTTYTYDGPGNQASVTDQLGNVVQYTYDAANQLKTVVQTASPSANNTNSYGYDPGGNLTGIADENNHITMTSFDQLYRLTAKVLPDGSLTETRQYDAAGNLISLTHFNGVTTTYTYDALNRLLSRSTPGEATVSFTYTATGKYATSTDASGTTTYTYDSMDRLMTKATPEGTLNYTFDAAGHVATIASSNTNGAFVSYSYDDLNRLSAVVDNRLSSGANTTTYTYDPANNLATATYPNGLQSAFTYDSLNRMTTLVTPVSGYSYQFDATGKRIQAIELTGRTLNWNYDGISRLTQETIADAPASKNGVVSYGLDPVGNRLSDTSSLSGVSSSSSTFNADDELSGETYDNNGNTLTSGGKTFTYDAENYLTGMSVSGTTVSIVYDAFGNRVSKTVNGVTTKYLVEDDVNPTGYPQVMEEIVGGSVERTYTYGLQRISQDQLISSAWTPSFYGYDGAGSVRQLTNAAGTITDTYDYDAFGNEVNHTGTTPNNYLYRAEQYDPDLGLYYLRARYFNPVTGRFLSRDPLGGRVKGPSTLHKYLYSGGDPVNYIDPSGRGDELFEYEALAEGSLTLGKQIATYGCYATILTTAASLLLAKDIGGWDIFGAAAAGYGCVSLSFATTAETGIGEALLTLKTAGDYALCGASLATLVHDLNTYINAKPEEKVTTGFYLDTAGAVIGCVGTVLGTMLDEEGEEAVGDVVL